MAVQEFLRALTNPAFRPSAVKVALVVGSILFTINHGEAVLQQKMTRSRWFAALLTYAVPYSVNVHGQLSAHKRFRREPLETLAIAPQEVISR